MNKVYQTALTIAREIKKRTEGRFRVRVGPAREYARSAVAAPAVITISGPLPACFDGEVYVVVSHFGETVLDFDSAGTDPDVRRACAGLPGIAADDPDYLDRLFQVLDESFGVK